MICLIALVVFGVLGIFSARYRSFAREAFHCVGRRTTFRPCDTEFDKKMKAKITGKLMKRSPKTARFVHHHFEAISWVFTVLLIVSLAYSAYSLYNLAVHGTCDPTDFCPITGKYGEGQCILNNTSAEITAGFLPPPT